MTDPERAGSACASGDRPDADEKAGPRTGPRFERYRPRLLPRRVEPVLEEGLDLIRRDGLGEGEDQLPVEADGVG